MRLSTHSLILGATVLYLASPALTILVPKSVSQDTYNSQSERTARNASAFAQMLGEFRTSLADMLFVKTERYLDSGVGYEPHIDAREMQKTGLINEQGLDDTLADATMKEAVSIAPGQTATHSDEGNDHAGHDHGHDHDHGEEGVVQTLIRTTDSDFRGFIGNLERQVKPWRDPNQPHQHTAGTELLPWYRIATLSDPHNVRNFMIGAWWLKSLDDPKQKQEAIKFLDEGIAKNPAAYELYLMKGYVLRDLENVKGAKQSFAKSADLALKERPDTGPQEKGTWDITDEEQMIAAMTMHTLLVRDDESTATALTVIKAYQKRLPGEGALKRVEDDLGH